MSKLFWQMLKAAPVVVGGSLLIASGANAETAPGTQPLEIAQNSEEILEQIETYSNETDNGSLGQSVQGASKFRDVSPNDWAFQALDDLIRRYDCLVGYPNGTFRGNRPLTRYEFAAGLNACLNQIERLIASATADFVTRDDLETLRALLQEFEAELIALGTRVDSLEARTAFLEDHQFSTTTKLNGEVIFNLADVFTDLDQQFDTDRDGLRDDGAPGGGNTTFADRVRLNLDTSFTGRDRLRVRLQGRNIISPVNSIRNLGVTNEGRLSFEGDEGNDVFVDYLGYRFPIADGRGQAEVFANGGAIDDYLNTVNPFDSSGSGFVGRFASRNPIYRVGGQNAGLGVSFDVTDNINLAGFYLAGEANDPSAGAGLFNGDYSAGGQITFEANRFTIAGTYIHGYTGSSGVGWGVGSRRSGNFEVASPFGGSTAPVSTNNYGVQVNFDFTDKLFIGGWGGYTAATAIGVGDGDIWNWAGYVGLRDLGMEGSKLGFLVGMEPKLAGSDANVATLGIRNFGTNRADRDTSLHLEGIYAFPVNDNILITPGVIVITNPGHNSTNPTLWIGTLRTTFKF
ncbi:MAG: iron uptake porin [Jaaginema sp. PMC 1079.18]|nr:iron uptake porin [Jaaginema sp. PMC 1080.18]MEC4852029.1 iron uptake porin [Jaaginema sp. PMC 1079.18]MEC4865773.1 iron uptake porin [Jaaginema sp. PMC 1078.18]